MEGFYYYSLKTHFSTAPAKVEQYSDKGHKERSGLNGAYGDSQEPRATLINGGGIGSVYRSYMYSTPLGQIQHLVNSVIYTTI
jgi:hypothetical protein